MCGIAGIVVAEGRADLRAVAAGMGAAGAHRGPDDAGTVVFVEDGRRSWVPRAADKRDVGPELAMAALSHRRLSIIDLSASGHQPMSDSSGRLWIVFNGEIYNYLELRRELEGKGRAFSTRSDTEVILEAWKEWGPSCQGRFNGMWAFALLDLSSRKLFLSRDRFGVKPLVYVVRPGLIAFGSELRQVLPLLESVRLDLEMTADFLFWDVQDHTDRSFVEGARSVVAGTCLEADRDAIETGEPSVSRYWEPSALAPDDARDVTRTFRGLLEDSVRLRLRSDVPVAVTLSGGLDSSSIACLAAGLRRSENTSEPLLAFTAVFDDEGYSEAEYAQRVVDHVGMASVRIRPDAPDLERDWRDFVRVLEAPFSSLAYYANWKVYQRIHAEGVKVVLNGQGGDELLLGYDRYRVNVIRTLLMEGRFRQAVREALRARKNASLATWRVAAYLLYFLLPAVRASRRMRLLRPFVRPELLEVAAGRVSVLRDMSRHESTKAFLAKEFTAYQLPHLLHHEDRVSMSVGVESRSPFLDYRLFELASGLSSSMLVKDGWSKWILREAMRGVLPEEIRLRTAKMGYDTPTGRLLCDAEGAFAGLLDRNRRDELLNVLAIESAMKSGSVRDTVLCGLLSLLSFREEFGVAA